MKTMHNKIYCYNSIPLMVDALVKRFVKLAPISSKTASEGANNVMFCSINIKKNFSIGKVKKGNN